MEVKPEAAEVELVFEPLGKRVKVGKGTTIMDAARALLIDLSSICGEKGTCGKCQVRIDSGLESLGPLKAAELRHLTRDEIDLGYRLACLNRAVTDMIITIPERSRVGKQRLQTEGLEIPVEPRPFIRKYHVRLTRATLEDAKPDDARLLDALREQLGTAPLQMDYEAALSLPSALRSGGWEVTATLWDGKEIIAVEAGDTTSRCYGFAVDIGTTKLAGFLVHLDTGKVLAVAARMNPQIPYGEDVMSRVTYSMGGANKLAELQRVVIGGINELIDECCKKAEVDPSEIYECTFVGNTCMHHLFLNIPPKQVGLSPYVPAVSRGLNLRASKLPGLSVHPNANVYVGPTMGGFVGADSVADVLVADMLESDEIILDIDIGTNTEIALGNKEKVMITSCASGPAFEGMHIKNGMRAATGAIEKITIDPQTYEVSIRTIDDAKPVGICGSALIDAPAELLKAGIIDRRGRFISEAKAPSERLRGALARRLRANNGVPEFVLAPREETAIETDIVITQDDILEILKAKAAMRVGSTVLMRLMNIGEGDISKLIIAGAFGNYVDPASARTIGMYPEVTLDKVVFVGNSAGTGARMMLVSKLAREYGERIRERVEYYELATDPNFAVQYATCMYLPHMDLDKYPITKELLERLSRLRE